MIVIFKDSEVLFMRMFYIVIDFIFIRALHLLTVKCKDSLGYLCKNVLYIMRFIFIIKLYLL